MTEQEFVPVKPMVEWEETNPNRWTIRIGCFQIVIHLRAVIRQRITTRWQMSIMFESRWALGHPSSVIKNRNSMLLQSSDPNAAKKEALEILKSKCLETIEEIEER